MATDIFGCMANGEFDGQLDQIFEALKARRKYVARQQALINTAEFGPETPVRVIAGISPKFLIGVTGMVSKSPARRPGFIQVDIDAEYHDLVSGRFGTSVGVPANCLERVA